MSTLPEKPQINALTATRAVAALLVFVHHTGWDIFPYSCFPYVFHTGNIAVGYFFVLSGFVLYISYSEKNIEYGDYIMRRVGRILPVYLLALLLSAIVAVSFFNYNLFSLRSLSEVLLSALCLQSFIPSYPLVLNFPAWSISVEMFFYFLFPVLLFFQKKHLKVFVIAAVALYFFSQYINTRYLLAGYKMGDKVFDVVSFNPIMHLSQFLAGMVGGYIYNRTRHSLPKYSILPFILLAAIVAVIALKPGNISFQVGLLAPLFMVLIVFVAASNPRALNARPFVFLGEISYGIYILQHPVYTFLDMLNKKYTHIPNEYFFYCALAILISVATAAYYIIEVPVRKKLISQR